MKRGLAISLAALVLAAVAASGAEPGKDEVYLFAYFTEDQGSGGDGLHLAYSLDGLDWKEIERGRIYFTPLLGMFRDPFIMQGPDGVFHLVWTSGKKEIGHATSADLWNWADQQYIKVMANERKSKNIWAPEIIYDDQKRGYMIYWSSTIPGRFPETDQSGDHKLNHRIYYAFTPDFKTMIPAALLLDPGFNCIDADIVKAGNEFVMFLKNETLKPVKKHIVVLRSNRLRGGWGPASEPITESWAEGPSAIRIGEQWFVYFDLYKKKRYGVAVSSDLSIWQDLSAQLKMPRSARHGCAFKVSPESFAELSR